MQWYLFATLEAREASDLPYRHVFGVWAPCVGLIIALSPWIATKVFEVPQATRDRFRELLRSKELFINRPDDREWSCRRIWNGIVYGPAYHPLHLLLLPSFVALMAPANGLNLMVIVVSFDSLVKGTFFVSFMLLAWGDMSSRWQELNTFIERWFLAGGPFFVSLFVILVAVLRYNQFEYVSTLLDATPFGMIFGLVVMNYVLFWLVEYWMNRVAAVHLLGVLGPVSDEVCVRYDAEHVQQNPNDPIKVNRHKRFLASHGTGRFVVVGTVGELDPVPTADSPAGDSGPAFQAYYFMDLFSRLGECTADPKDHDRDMDIRRFTGTYFSWLNGLIIVVTATFLGFFAYEHWYANNAMNPVVEALDAPPPPE
jgi:hypothetical protein